MRVLTRTRRSATVVVATVAALLFLTVSPAAANVPLTLVSSDPYTDAQAQHRTEVGPDTFVAGDTIVAAFQVGRVFNGGASNIGFATSTDGGATWRRGFLPGITRNEGGPYERASNPAVAFDARHNVWLISSLAIDGPGTTAVLTSRSTDGGLTWSNPITTATGLLDKTWIVCDNTSVSPFFGNCYTQYDILNQDNAIRLRTSTNGGLTWGPARATDDNASGVGGQPVVRNNGTVIVPYRTAGQIRSFRSIDGGASWRVSVPVANIDHHTVSGGLRESPLPSAEVDAAGTVHVAWADCRFRLGCPRNDIVISRSTSEVTWSDPVRVPIDATSSSVEHFTPGLGIDRTTAGPGGRIGLTYYFYPNSSCSASTCQLNVGFISSANGGTSWSAPTQVAGPMSLSWLPNTSQGRMFGDYISTSLLPLGNAFPVIPVASAPSGGLFNVPMFVPTGGLPITGGSLQDPATVPGPAPAADTPLSTI